MHLSLSKNSGRMNQQRQDVEEGSESDYSPQVQKFEAKRGKKRGKNVQIRKKQNFNNSTWNLEENVLYKDFIIKNYHLFHMQRQQRRAIKINVLISKYVKTRTSDQCRSHHQKMLIYHHSLDSIVAHIENLQARRKNPKISQTTQSEDPETPNSSTLEMKEIEEVKVSPSLWDFMVQDVWFEA